MPNEVEQDEVMREVRAIREAYAARFDYDIGAIFRDAKAKEHESGHEVVVRAPRRAKAVPKPKRGRAA